MDTHNLSPTKRFSARVINYGKYLAQYPVEIIPFFKNKKILTSDSVIADIGSGTGLLTKIFLENGNVTYGVELNKEIREAGEKYLKRYPNFISKNGTAEKTNLRKNSVDIIIAGQAFHWLNVLKAKKEFMRILKPGGYVILLWNTKHENSAFMKAYHGLMLKYGTYNMQISHEAVGKNVLFNFYNKKFKFKSFYNKQDLNYESFSGRFLSSPYIPLPSYPNYRKMTADLKKIFEIYQNNNTVIFKYKTKVFWEVLV